MVAGWLSGAGQPLAPPHVPACGCTASCAGSPPLTHARLTPILPRMSRWHLDWLAWSVAMTALVVGLGLQVRYASEALQCALDTRMALCAGPLPDWLMPATVALGLALVGLAARRLVLASR